jgi:hypothetical protein
MLAVIEQHDGASIKRFDNGDHSGFMGANDGF